MNKLITNCEKDFLVWKLRLIAEKYINLSICSCTAVSFICEGVFVRNNHLKKFIKYLEENY